jgi:hypothetical protein
MALRYKASSAAIKGGDLRFLGSVHTLLLLPGMGSICTGVPVVPDEDMVVV